MFGHIGSYTARWVHRNLRVFRALKAFKALQLSLAESGALKAFRALNAFKASLAESGVLIGLAKWL